MINPQAGLEERVQERVKRHVLEADSTTQSVAKSSASVRSCRPAIARVQARGLSSGVPGERSDETGMRSDIHHAPTRSDKSRGLRQYPAPIVHISVDKCAYNRVKAGVAERRDTCVGLDQISCSASLLGHVKLVRRHIDACGEPSGLDECRQLYTTAATKFETAPRSGTKPVTEQGCGALRERTQVRVIPDSVAVVPSGALHAGNGRTSPIPPVGNRPVDLLAAPDVSSARRIRDTAARCPVSGSVRVVTCRCNSAPPPTECGHRTCCSTRRRYRCPARRAPERSRGPGSHWSMRSPRPVSLGPRLVRTPRPSTRTTRSSGQVPQAEFVARHVDACCRRFEILPRTPVLSDGQPRGDAPARFSVAALALPRAGVLNRYSRRNKSLSCPHIPCVV